MLQPRARPCVPQNNSCLRRPNLYTTVSSARICMVPEFLCRHCERVTHAENTVKDV